MPRAEFERRERARRVISVCGNLLLENVLGFVAAEHHFLDDSLVARDLVDRLSLRAFRASGTRVHFTLN